MVRLPASGPALKNAGARLAGGLASVRLAVLLMATLAIVCIAATFFEVSHGTPAAQRAFYGTGWFSTLLALLGVNVFGSMMKRYPWNRHHTGFVLAHMGIVLLLGGSLLSLHAGLDGQMALYEGETTDRLNLPGEALLVTRRGAPGATISVQFEGREAGPVGRRFPLPGGDLLLVVDEYQPSVEVTESGTRPTPVPEEDRGLPAVKVHLEGSAGASAAEWVAWSDARPLAFGGSLATVAYAPPQKMLPFRLTLLHFRSEKYPGSSMAATYESRVRVEDPERGVTEHLISMNHPLHHRGYIFFQSSFVEGEPVISIFSVARSPGLPLVYLGTALISVGVLWMFYLKPYLARRQGRLALEALAAE